MGILSDMPDQCGMASHGRHHRPPHPDQPATGGGGELAARHAIIGDVAREARGGTWAVSVRMRGELVVSTEGYCRTLARIWISAEICRFDRGN
jgi:hypothetical protein